jgi:hypothetical protein
MEFQLATHIDLHFFSVAFLTPLSPPKRGKGPRRSSGFRIFWTAVNSFMGRGREKGTKPLWRLGSRERKTPIGMVERPADHSKDITLHCGY